MKLNLENKNCRFRIREILEDIWWVNFVLIGSCRGHKISCHGMFVSLTCYFQRNLFLVFFLTKKAKLIEWNFKWLFLSSMINLMIEKPILTDFSLILTTFGLIFLNNSVMLISFAHLLLWAEILSKVILVRFFLHSHRRHEL